MSTTQAPLWTGDLSGGGRAHVNGHETEKEAAKADRSVLRQRVLQAFKDAGPRGLSDYECSVRCAIARPHSAATRRAELQRRGYDIRDTGRRRPTDSGKSAIVWMLMAVDE